MRKENIPDRFEFKAEVLLQGRGVDQQGRQRHRSPDGKIIAGPLDEEEGIIYAEMDPRQMRGPKWNLDVAGHYARPDVFQLTVNQEVVRLSP